MSVATLEPEADSCIECWSLAEEARREALFERWIRSREVGYDLGTTVINRWIHIHWPGFLRARWIEHMLGVRYWSELDRNEFGILRNTPSDRLSILEEIVEQLRCGAENLDIIRWSRRTKNDVDQRTVLDLLLIINVNAHRMRCLFSDC